MSSPTNDGADRTAASGSIGPVELGERLQGLDALRGFALFGVLAANIYLWFNGTYFSFPGHGPLSGLEPRLGHLPHHQHLHQRQVRLDLLLPLRARLCGPDDARRRQGRLRAHAPRSTAHGAAGDRHVACRPPLVRRHPGLLRDPRVRAARVSQATRQDPARLGRHSAHGGADDVGRAGAGLRSTGSTGCSGGGRGGGSECLTSRRVRGGGVRRRRLREPRPQPASLLQPEVAVQRAPRVRPVPAGVLGWSSADLPRRRCAPRAVHSGVPVGTGDRSARSGRPERRVGPRAPGERLAPAGAARRRDRGHRAQPGPAQHVLCDRADAALPAAALAAPDRGSRADGADGVEQLFVADRYVPVHLLRLRVGADRRGRPGGEQRWTPSFGQVFVTAKVESGS